jgi:hypothetical protein
MTMLHVCIPRVPVNAVHSLLVGCNKLFVMIMYSLMHVWSTGRIMRIEIAEFLYVQFIDIKV